MLLDDIVPAHAEARNRRSESFVDTSPVQELSVGGLSSSFTKTESHRLNSEYPLFRRVFSFYNSSIIRLILGQTSPPFVFIRSIYARFSHCLIALS